MRVWYNGPGPGFGIRGVLLSPGKIVLQDKRMQEAIDLVISKRDEQGRWILESTFNRRFQVNIEQKGKPGKWITLNALRATRMLKPFQA